MTTQLQLINIIIIIIIITIIIIIIINQRLHLLCDLYLRKISTKFSYAFLILQCAWDKSSGVLPGYMTRLNLRRPPDLEARGSKKGCCEITIQTQNFQKLEKSEWVGSVFVCWY